MNDMLNSLEGFDSGSNYKFGQKMEKAKNPRSLFDLSHLNTMTIDNAGLLIPIALWETLPTDDFDISVDALLRVMPQVVPLYSRQRLFIYGFYSRYSDLWNHWQVFMDKGYTGNVSKKIPTLNGYTDSSHSYNINYNYNTSKITPNTLFDYLGLPIGCNSSDLFGYQSAGTIYGYAGISALPFMMYLRIYRDYFMNKNEWINDRVMLPDDDSRFRLDDDGQILSAKDESCRFHFGNCDGSTGEWYNDLTVSSNDYFMGLLFHDYPDDYFTSALPFTQRGTSSTLKANAIINGGTLNGTMDFSSVVTRDTSNTGHPLNIVARKDNNGIDKLFVTDASITATTFRDTEFVDAMNHAIPSVSLNNVSVNLDTGITIENLREQIINQIELERLARTDGSYRQFGLSFFGESSKASYDFRPTYIGGTYKNLAFTEVLQTAPGSSGQTPLASYAGHGITGISKGRIGHIHCDDYGMIMLIACIMPDVYYSQGLDRILTDSLQADKWLPERVKLGMQPIYNKEIYYAGNNGSDSGEDNYLWAYQNPFDYLRYIPNKIHGKIADSTNNSFFPYTQSRKFNSLPNWGREFSEAKDVRKDYLAAYSESAYSVQFGINIRAVRPLPYKAIPAELLK